MRFFTLFGMLCLFLVGANLAAGADMAPVAAPHTATLYPGGARLEVRQQLEFNEGSARLALPINADISDVRLAVNQESVRAMRIESGKVEPAHSATLLLRQEYETARTSLWELEGRLAAMKARQELWASPDVSSFATPDLFVQIEDLMSRRLAGLHVEMKEIEHRRELASQEVERLRNALERAGGTEEGYVLAVQLETAATGMREAELQYKISGSGWSPKYRFEAFPQPVKGGREEVRFVQQAELLQASGQDWKEVVLFLATADPGGRVAPRPTRPWRIAPRETVMLRAPVPAMAAESKVVMYDQASPEPLSPNEYATYSVWEVGARNVPAGTATLITLSQDVWPVEFVRLARPALDVRAYLMAQVKLDEHKVYPSGEATYYVQGEMTGRRQFSMADKEAELFFGVDPRVSVIMTLDSRQSGKKGLVGRRQTRTWSWTIDVKNGHPEAVKVRIEDPQPQSGDEAISINVDSSPSPEVREQTYVWNLDLPGEGERKISHTVTASAPEDMVISDGR